MRALLPVLGVALMIAACSDEPDDAPVAAASSQPPAAPAATPPPLPEARKVDESTELYQFAFSYPAEAAVIPALKALLDADIVEDRSELAAKAKAQREESRKQGYPFNPFFGSTVWSVVADLPGWLSLSAEVGSFEGGAHPNHGFAAMLWDKRANARREAGDLFTSDEALSAAIRKDFCREIDKQRARKRGEPVDPGSGGMFDDCIDPVESTIILGSSNKRAFDRIGVLVGPYEAGPYVEGDYEVTLPVTDAVLAAVKPEYRAAFVKGR